MINIFDYWSVFAAAGWLSSQEVTGRDQSTGCTHTTSRYNISPPPSPCKTEYSRLVRTTISPWPATWRPRPGPPLTCPGLSVSPRESHFTHWAAPGDQITIKLFLLVLSFLPFESESSNAMLTWSFQNIYFIFKCQNIIIFDTFQILYWRLP